MKTTNPRGLTTIQISKKTLKKLQRHCRRARIIQRYFVESLLEQALLEQGIKGKGSGQSQPLPAVKEQQ